MQTIYDLCQPRADVIQGRIRDEEFSAESSRSWTRHFKLTLYQAIDIK